MNDLFVGVQPFVAVARTLSFRQAARQLGVTPAAVSKAVTRLEAGLGVTLFARTSRRVELTPEGAVFFDRCREAVAQLEAGRALVDQARTLPSGRVDISVPFLLGAVVVRALAPFADRYPLLDLRLHLTDRKVALVGEQIDVAIRIGTVEDASVVARHLGTPSWVTVAAPSYLARHGTPRSIEDVATHRCLMFATPSGRPAPWCFATERGKQAIAVTGPLQIDQGERLVDAARAGIGIAQVFHFMVADDLAAGRLVAVLEAYGCAGEPVHLVTRPRATRSPRIRGVVELLATELQRFLPSTAPS
ncbi:MAG: transcriptional regulator, LysR family [Deltaproteobacteria bacterium]|nr:transcriptional regulator, LysR family [Deltaproteobacteria bacterium]